jgi:hypothetical protein
MKNQEKNTNTQIFKHIIKINDNIFNNNSHQPFLLDYPLKNLIKKIENKKEKCLSYILKQLFNITLNEDIFERITIISNNDNAYCEKYFLDYGKKSQTFLMEIFLTSPSKNDSVDYKENTFWIYNSIYFQVNSTICLKECI